MLQGDEGLLLHKGGHLQHGSGAVGDCDWCQPPFWSGLVAASQVVLSSLQVLVITHKQMGDSQLSQAWLRPTVTANGPSGREHASHKALLSRSVGTDEGRQVTACIQTNAFSHVLLSSMITTHHKNASRVQAA